MTLACEYVDSKLVDVITVADDSVGNNLLQIWKLRYGHKAKLSKTKTFVKTLSTRFGQDFEV